MATTTEITTLGGGTAVPLNQDVIARLNLEARDVAANERPMLGRFSLKAGILSLNGNPIKGNKLRCVILASAFVQRYYAKAYNEDDLSNPSCFALAHTEDELVPHPNVPQPINHDCKTCPKNEWGSTSRPGSRGKACQETRRLLIMPEDSLESPDAVVKAELAVMYLPVTSVRQWGNYINTLAAAVGMPFYAVVTEISLQPDIKTQFKVILTPVAMVSDNDVMQALLDRRTSVDPILMAPFEVSSDNGQDPTPEAEPKAGGKAKF